MTEHDPLRALLREWQAREPSPELDERITTAYRDVVCREAQRAPILLRFWRTRVSVPAPVLAVGALLAVAVFVWFRGAAAPKVLPVTPNVVTRLNASGFQPLPNGEARVIPISELKKGTALKK
jgi:hypothetical protein